MRLVDEEDEEGEGDRSSPCGLAMEGKAEEVGGETISSFAVSAQSSRFLFVEGKACTHSTEGSIAQW